MTNSTLLNDFLDSTPRQWISHFLINLQKNSFFLVSVLVHASFVLLFLQNITVSPRVTHSPELNQFEVSIISPPKSSIQQSLETDSDFIIGKSKKNLKKIKVDPLAHLLNQLKAEKNLKLSLKQNLDPKFHSENTKNTQGNQLMKDSQKLLSQLLVQVPPLKKETPEKEKEVQKLLLKLIDSFQPQFRGCFEQAKLQDPNLSGQVSIAIQTSNTGNSSNIRFQGQGNNQSRNNLNECLTRVSNKIHSPDLDQETTVKFGLVLL